MKINIIKTNNGITLTVLIIAVIILSIVVSISIKASQNLISNSKDKALIKDLSIIVQEYNLALEKAEISATDSNIEEKLRELGVEIKEGTFYRIYGENVTRKYITVEDLEKLKEKLGMVDTSNASTKRISTIKIDSYLKTHTYIDFKHLTLHLDSKDRRGRTYFLKNSLINAISFKTIMDNSFRHGT